MDFSSAFLLAIRALARNKLRSALTMLGIIIGVGAVIAVVGIGQGAAAKAQEQLAAMGSNMLFVGSGSVNRYGLNVGSGQTKTLVIADARAIARECPSVSNVAPGTGTGQQVVFGNQNWATQITGTEPQYFEVRNWPFASGISFGDDDVTQSATVAVLGDTVRRYLFGSTNPIGETIRIGNLPFKVVGVLIPKGISAEGGQDQDDAIFVPLTTVQKKLLGQQWLRWIMVSAVSRDASYVAQRQIVSLLRDRHKIRPGDPNDFVVRNLADIADAAAEQGSVEVGVDTGKRHGPLATVAMVEWRLGDSRLDLTFPAAAGIVNVTVDSMFEGARSGTPEQAIADAGHRASPTRGPAASARF